MRRLFGLFSYLGMVCIVVAGCVISIYFLHHQRDSMVLSMDRGLKEQVELPMLTVTADMREEVHLDDADVAKSSSGQQIEYINGVDSNLLRQVDFSHLQALNPDVRTWISIPDTNIDYYVMQENTVGSYYYLWRDIYKNRTSWGSIFTPKIPQDADDAHFLVLGHRMKNMGVAFSTLSSYKSQSYAETHRYVYLYYPDRAERWVVWGACNLEPTDMVYNIPYSLGSDDYAALLDHLNESALFTFGDAPDVNTRTLVLSTCHDNDTRFLLICVCDRTLYY